MSKEESGGYDIETLMIEYGNDVLRTAYMYVKDMHVAEDIFQEVFIKVNNKLDTFHGNSSIKTWIIRITINTCKDHLKSAWNRRVTVMEEYEESSLQVESDFTELEKQEESKVIQTVIMELPKKYKDIILCIYYHQLTIQEVSKSLGIPEGTVKSRLSRAKEKLRKELERREFYGW